jgi:uncharacterized membrane protein YqiK
MGTFILGSVILLAALLAILVGIKTESTSRNSGFKFGALGGGVLAAIVGVIMIIVSTALYVEDNQAGIVTKKFGTDLPAGKIIAVNGEKGPQADVLPPGWHFGYWPWLYQLTPFDNVIVPQGAIGVVTAMDGKPLASDDIFAPAWESPSDMLDARKFLEGDGRKGPQLTVLPPGQYRDNPRLFKIEGHSALEVPVGSVAVIKSNVGELYVPKEGEVVQSVNGVPIVPNGYRGIWADALQPNAYYMHPAAYVVKFVQTTKRVYSYTDRERASTKSDRPEENNSVEVKTKDGFKFPVDVRVSVKISAEDAPYVVAMLADPDVDDNNDGFDTLEERAILPSIRSIFRNTAETKGALEYLDSRSSIEEDATRLFAEDMKEFKIDVDRVYIADIGLDKTEQGQDLLATQTDKELAKQQQETNEEKERAQLSRAAVVKAEEDANQEKQKAAAKAQVIIAEDEAAAAIKRAEGDAAGYAAKVEALGGTENFIKLEMFKMVLDRWNGELPLKTLVMGGADNGGLDTATLAAIHDRFSGAAAPQPVASKTRAIERQAAGRSK